jgi:hypothetical protein
MHALTRIRYSRAKLGNYHSAEDRLETIELAHPLSNDDSQDCVVAN